MRREVSSSPGFESLETKHFLEHYINEVGDGMLQDEDREIPEGTCTPTITSATHTLPSFLQQDEFYNL
jgi:hypothetical protein